MLLIVGAGGGVFFSITKPVIKLLPIIETIKATKAIQSLSCDFAKPCTQPKGPLILYAFELETVG